MKTTCVLSAIFILCAPALLLAQRDSVLERKLDRCAVGIAAGEFAHNWGLGVEVTSPEFGNSGLSVRMKAGTHWLECYKAEKNHWATYTLAGIYMVYNSRVVEHVRAFAEVGTFAIIPNKHYSSTSAQGISATVGAELFVARNGPVPVCYFFGLGLGYSHARAEKLEAGDAYAHGLLFTNGFRFYF